MQGELEPVSLAMSDPVLTSAYKEVGHVEQTRVKGKDLLRPLVMVLLVMVLPVTVLRATLLVLVNL